ncbi:MAG: hypothetical protein DBY36_00845 [Clostridiales bacterium]|nr:MAG: hypothetical protein DBY36_00845 [Clostridiales bacterium]
MKKFAKLLSMVLAVAMVLTMFVGAFEYKDDAAIDEDKAEAVYAVYDWAVMQGNDKGEFNPKGLLTRDEMSKIMYALKEVGLDVASYYGGFLSVFTDAAKVPNWSKNYMGYAYIQNIFIGNDQKQINALGNLSYVQAAIVLLRAMGMENANNTYKVGDVEYNRYEGPKWFNNAVADGITNKLFEDLDISDFKANITREDVAVMIYNAVSTNKAKFKVADKMNDIVVGTETKDKVDYFELADGTLYPIGDLKVADYIGKEVEFSMEDKEIVSTIKVVNSTSIDTTIGAIVIKDGELKVGSDVIVKKADLSKYSAYVFQNGAIDEENIEIGTEKNAAGTKTNLYGWLDVEANRTGFDFQNATVIVNSGKKIISIVYNPVVFVNTANVVVKPEVDGKVLTGKYQVTLPDGVTVYVPELINELPNNTWLAVSLNGDTAEIVGFPKIVDISKLSATKKGSGVNAVYSFTVDGSTAINVADVASAFVYSKDYQNITDETLYNALAGTGKNILVFEDKIIGLDSQVSQDVSIAVVLDYVSSYSGGIEYVTMDAIVDGALTQLTAKADAITGLAVGKVYVIDYADADDGDVKKGDMTLTLDSNFSDGYAVKQFVTALGEITLNKASADRTVSLTGKTLIGYDVQTNTVFDVNNLVVIGDSAKLDGKNIYKGALSVAISQHAVIVLYDIGE